ncbi:hypothetical protein HZB89_00850 [archaeon]|nr:hypothetical protein [archaeon]
MAKNLLMELIDLKARELKAKNLYIYHLEEINESTKKAMPSGADAQKFFNYKKIIERFNELFPLIAGQEQEHFERCQKMLALIQPQAKK